MNFTELTSNTLCYSLMDGRGNAVTQCVHTLNVTSALQNNKPIYFNKMHTHRYMYVSYLPATIYIQSGSGIESCSKVRGAI